MKRQQQEHPQAYQGAGAPTDPGAYAIQLHPEQQRINQYILAEIAKVKKDNKRLNDEVLALRLENMSLNNRLNSSPQYGLPVEYSAASPVANSKELGRPIAVEQNLPFVQFNMRQQPPTVESANIMFCSLLGYTMDEVYGQPWHKFIHDDFVERTVRMVQRDSGGSDQAQFGQVYKDRNGHPVPCQDFHTFLRDEKGRLVTDYVVVRPEGASYNEGSPFAMFGGMSQPQSLPSKRPVPSIMGTGGEFEGVFATSPLQMMDESGDDMLSPSPPPPPMLGVSGEWNPSVLPWEMEDDLEPRNSALN